MSLRLGNGAIYEALESDLGETTTGGTKSKSSKLWPSELDTNDPSRDECCVVSEEFTGNDIFAAVLSPSNTPFLGTCVRAETATFRCSCVSGTVGRGPFVDVGTIDEGLSCM